MRRRPLLIALWMASLLWFAAMAAFVEWRLGPQGATPLPDTSLTGHTADSLMAWALDMTDRGRALVLGPYRLMDTVFPLLLALTLAVTGGRRRWWLGVLACAYALLDIAENASLAAILRAAPAAPGADEVARASALTIAKWITIMPAAGLGFWLLLTELRGKTCSSP